MGVIGNLATILSVRRCPQSRLKAKAASDEAAPDEALPLSCFPFENPSTSANTICRASPPTQGVLTKEKCRSATSIFLSQEQRWVLLDPVERTLSYWAPKKGWVVLDLDKLRNAEYDITNMRLVLYFLGCSLRFKTHSEDDFVRWRDAIAECLHPTDWSWEGHGFLWRSGRVQSSKILSVYKDSSIWWGFIKTTS